jgi:hypothetical protein
MKSDSGVAWAVNGSAIKIVKKAYREVFKGGLSFGERLLIPL